MKKIFVILLLLLIPLKVYAFEYTDKVYGIKFNLGTGWEEVNVSDERKYISVKFEHEEYGTLMFGIVDVYASFSEEEKRKTSRSDINNDYFKTEELKTAFGDEYNIKKVYNQKYGDNDFLVAEGTLSYKNYNIINGQTISNTAYTPAEINVKVLNGYMIMFLHYNFDNTPGTDSYNDHINIVSSLDLSNFDYGNIIENNKEINFINIIISLIFTFAIYSIIPIVIRIYNKKPLEKEKAHKISLINSIGLGLLFIIISNLINIQWSSGVAFFYYFINKFILTKKINIVKK